MPDIGERDGARGRHLSTKAHGRRSGTCAQQLTGARDQGVKAEIGRVHGNRLVWREELLGQGKTNFDVVS